MKNIRYGVIGTGMMGVEHIENILHIENTTVTAISDPATSSREAALATCAGRGPVESFDDHRDLLASGLCDAVVVASPNHTHLDVLTDVTASGLHVLIEKPMCHTVEDAEKLLALVDATAHIDPQRQVWVGLEYRYMPPIAALIAELKTGVIGTPRMVAIREHRFPFLHKVDHWNRFSANTGGTLVEKCCHFFDLMCLLFEDRPIQVMASGGHDVNHFDESYDDGVPDILDNAYVIVDFPGGRRGMLDLCMFAEATHNQEELAVIGELGKLEALIPDNVVRLGIRGEDFIGNVTTTEIAQNAAHAGLHHGSSYFEHVRFAAAIRGEQETEVTPTDGLWSVAIGHAAHRSIEENRPVRLDEVLELS